MIKHPDDIENPCPKCGAESEDWGEMPDQPEVVIMRCTECYARFHWSDETGEDEVIS